MQKHKPILPLNVDRRFSPPATESHYCPGTWSAAPWFLDDHPTKAVCEEGKSCSHWRQSRKPSRRRGGYRWSVHRVIYLEPAESPHRHWDLVHISGDSEIAFLQHSQGWIMQKRVRITGLTLTYQRLSLTWQRIIRTELNALLLLK